MKPKVLVSAPYAMPVIGRFKADLEKAGCEVVVAQVRERLEENELLAVIGDVDGLICGDDKVTAKVLAGAPKLKVISKWGTGIDSIDQEACKARGVQVRNTPNAFTEPVADTVLAWMLWFARKPAEQDRGIRAGKWEKPPLFALGEKTLGIIGVGHIGRAVARRARGFGMTLLGTDPIHPSENFLKETGMKMLPLEKLLSAADFISLNCDLNPSSRRLMDKKAFSLIKPGSYLLNAARGPIVVENDLVAALESGRLAGAGLDVYEREPLPADSALRRLSQVVMSPHNSNGSPRAYERVHASTIKNLLEGLNA
ncbi:MAG: phosphoglycerate dehydrogenase [Elusimicrobia bacterium]|nr:phosphoglycerate dehydrogenase [Elusimicrobiota bacterium]